MAKGKHQVAFIDGTPEKRLFLSIISDYDLFTGTCELIDNALDFWIRGNKQGSLTISLDLDSQSQVIVVRDNAGGVDEEHLRYLIAPGASGNDPKAELIGIFGVGGKRAGVALGRQVEIRTRAKNRTFQIDLDEEWTKSDNWDLAYYEVSSIDKGATVVVISKLRQSFSDQDIETLKEHCAAVYARFIDAGVTLSINGDGISAKHFDIWAFPKDHPPVSTEGIIDVGLPEQVKVKITGGLIRDRDPETENYGVYVYCNNRLITKELRTRDVGYYVTSEAGVPHPDASLSRVIVELNGPAEQMPWNSSKSGISNSHPVFHAVRSKTIELNAHFSSLSRRMKYEWEDEVFPADRGEIADGGKFEAKSNQRLNLPALPRVRRVPAIETLRSLNRKLMIDKPWTVGLVETIASVDYLERSKLHTRNRMRLILIDSAFEIAMKEFIATNPKLYPPHLYTDAQLKDIMKNRTKAINEVLKHVALPQTVIDKAQHYYGLRNKLIHERTTADIADDKIEDYENVLKKVLRKLFKIKFPIED